MEWSSSKTEILVYTMGTAMESNWISYEPGSTSHFFHDWFYYFKLPCMNINSRKSKTTLKYSQKCVFISLHIKIYQNKTYQVFIHKIKLHLIKNKKKKNKILECAALSNGELIGLQDMLFVKNFSSFWYFKFYK